MTRNPAQLAIMPRDGDSVSPSANNVFSRARTATAPSFAIPAGLALNQRMAMDGLEFLARLPESVIPVAFFDPQYRGVLDKLRYGNEGATRGRRRYLLKQMSEKDIWKFISAIDRCLMPSGHIFLWIDKFHLCHGFRHWMDGTALDVVDLVNWDKGRIGMGYRSRRRTEYCIVLQKQPRKAKGIWKKHDIPDTWDIPDEEDTQDEDEWYIPDTWKEKSANGVGHPHKKPINLQKALMSAVSNEGDIIIDPAAGDFTVLTAAERCGRRFLGCDLNG